ncbi:hypothetical protein EAS64_38895 [Trebonia kvetii]|uniref:Uncharacterized protein n=1 Tax=Trebonia kvetii TaxID=2480626 RepID=A0A6P2BPF6_9ACTN|nr:hypothetical protein [Trebonia kvetii]TVZ00045.1 hypothetical protein EAS64_38895 [Trebonia kvetii]
MTSQTKRHPLRTWRGPERQYDLVAEGTIAVIIVALLVILAASLWASPNGGLTYPGAPKSPAGQAFSAKYWDVNDPADLAATAVQELAGGSTTAGYGPPFNTTAGAAQQIIGIKPAEIAKWIFGLTLPVNTANDFVLAPVAQLVAPFNPAVAIAIRAYKAAGGDLAPGTPGDQVASPRQLTWLDNYATALSGSSAKVTPTLIAVKAGNYGPVPVIIAAELAIANNGSLDGYLQGSEQQLSTNTTMGTMFFSDSTLWGNIAEAQGVGGDQWGVMNELWNFPGQVWLWLYAGMYQIPALASNNDNLDLDVGLLMIVFGFLLPMFAPWIPVINRIPRWIPLYKIIYRRYYATTTGGQPPARGPGEPVPSPGPLDGASPRG